MPAKLPTGELLRLACVYAERDQRSLGDSYSGCNTPEDVQMREQAYAFADQIKAYRIKRWGKCRGDLIEEQMVTINLTALRMGSKEEEMKFYRPKMRYSGGEVPEIGDLCYGCTDGELEYLPAANKTWEVDEITDGMIKCHCYMSVNHTECFETSKMVLSKRRDNVQEV